MLLARTVHIRVYVRLLGRSVHICVYVRLLARTVGLVGRTVRMFFCAQYRCPVDETVWDMSATLCWISREDCAMLRHSGRLYIMCYAELLARTVHVCYVRKTVQCAGRVR